MNTQGRVQAELHAFVTSELIGYEWSFVQPHHLILKKISLLCMSSELSAPKPVWTPVETKNKTIPLRAWTGPEGSRRLRLLDFKKKSARESGKVVSPTHRPPLPPANIPGTHFCQRLNQTQGHSAAGRIMSMKNSNPRASGLYRSALVKCATACPRSRRLYRLYIPYKMFVLYINYQLDALIIIYS